MAAKQRYVLLSILATSLLAGLVAAHAAAWAMGAWGLSDTAVGGISELSLSHLSGFAGACGLAVAMAKITAWRTWLTEVVDELVHVSWPSRDETGHATVVVVVCVVVSALFLGLFDAAWLWLSNALMGLGPWSGS